MSPVYRVFLMVLGNIMDSHRVFMDQLQSEVNLCEANSEDDCDFIIAFVPIVSRAGTDIQAAVEIIPKGKPVVLVVLHHTFDPDYIAPDSRLCVNRDRVFAVDCLFHEDHGLLKCLRNNDAIRAVKKHVIGEEHSEVQLIRREEERESRLPADDSQSGWKMFIVDFVSGGVGGGVGGAVGNLVGGVVFCILAKSAGGTVGGALGGTVGGGVGGTMGNAVRSAVYGAVYGAIYGAIGGASGVLTRHVGGATGFPLGLVLGSSVGFGVGIGMRIVK